MIKFEQMWKRFGPSFFSEMMPLCSFFLFVVFVQVVRIVCTLQWGMLMQMQYPRCQ